MPTLLVRNMETGPTVFSVDAEKIHLEWQGRGDPEGRDLQRVPDKLMENVDFLRTIDRGILVIEKATPEMQAQIDAQAEAVKAHRAQAAAAIESVMDRTTERTIATAEISESGEIVTQEKASNERREGDTRTVDPNNVPSSVQMDEDGNIITEAPELQVTMTPREKE